MTNTAHPVDYRDVNHLTLTDVAVVDPPAPAMVAVTGYAPNAPIPGDVYISLTDAFGVCARINITPEQARQLAALLTAQAGEAER